MICATCLLYLFGGEFDAFSFNLLLLDPPGAENCYFPIRKYSKFIYAFRYTCTRKREHTDFLYFFEEIVKKLNILFGS